MPLLTALWGLSIIVALLGGIPYGIWITRCALKKQWRKVCVQVAAPISCFALLLGVTALGASREASNYVRDSYDANAEFGDPVFKYESERAFNGDGASLYVFDLPEPIRQRFEDPDERLMSKFPKRPHYRDHWSVVAWAKGPVLEEHEQYVDFALYASSDHTSEIREALSRETTFYSFFHYDHGSRPGNVDFFIVDLERGRIYEINVNT